MTKKMQGVEMKGRNFAGVAAVALGIVITAALAFSQAKGPERPGWFLQGSAPDPGGRLVVGPGGRVIGAPAGAGGGRGAPLAACTEDMAKICTGQTGLGGRACLQQNPDKLSAACKTA